MFYTLDGLRFNGFAPEPLAGTTTTFFDLRLTDPTATAFPSAALPSAAAAFDLSRYPDSFSVGPVQGLFGRSLVVTLGNDGFATGQITYRLDGLTVTPVPAPPAAGLLAVGAGVAGLLARVRRRGERAARVGSPTRYSTANGRTDSSRCGPPSRPVGPRPRGSSGHAPRAAAAGWPPPRPTRPPTARPGREPL